MVDVKRHHRRRVRLGRGQRFGGEFVKVASVGQARQHVHVGHVAELALFSEPGVLGALKVQQQRHGEHEHCREHHDEAAHQQRLVGRHLCVEPGSKAIRVCKRRGTQSDREQLQRGAALELTEECDEDRHIGEQQQGSGRPYQQLHVWRGAHLEERCGTQPDQTEQNQVDAPAHPQAVARIEPAQPGQHADGPLQNQEVCRGRDQVIARRAHLEGQACCKQPLGCCPEPVAAVDAVARPEPRHRRGG